MEMHERETHIVFDAVCLLIFVFILLVVWIGTHVPPGQSPSFP